MGARRSIWVAFVVTIAVCLPTSAQEYYTASKTTEVGAATETEALVCFVRPAFGGKAVRFWAFADQTPIGVTRGKEFTCGLVPPGTYIFWSRAENVSALRLEVAAGETYLIRQAVRMGGFKARVKLELLNATEGQEALRKCKKRTELTEEGRARAAEVVAEKWEKAQEKAAGGGQDEEDEEGEGAAKDEEGEG